MGGLGENKKNTRKERRRNGVRYQHPSIPVIATEQQGPNNSNPTRAKSRRREAKKKPTKKQAPNTTPRKDENLSRRGPNEREKKGG